MLTSAFNRESRPLPNIRDFSLKTLTQNLCVLLYITRILSLKSLQISQPLLNNLKVQILVRYHKKEAGHNFCDIILPYHNFMLSQIFARYHQP